jgi:hypothetical protein
MTQAQRRTFLPALLVTTLALASTGCGGGGSGTPGPGDGGVPPGSGTLNWLDDGARKNAVSPSAALARSSLMDYLQVTGSVAGGNAAVSFGVAATPPITPDTILCGGPGGTGQRPFASVGYTSGTDPIATSCSVTISTIVLTDPPHVTGTFEAVFPKTGGGTKTISDGHFDLAMTVSSI